MSKDHKTTASDEQTEVAKPKTQGYFFPDYGVTVEAASIEEAEQKVKKMFNKK